MTLGAERAKDWRDKSGNGWSFQRNLIGRSYWSRVPHCLIQALIQALIQPLIQPLIQALIQAFIQPNTFSIQRLALTDLP